MSFTFKESHLRRLCEINSFDIPQVELVFFGLRGCVTVNDITGQEFRGEHRLEKTDPNYQNPRCTIGQWRPATNEIACFAGSTVPFINNVRTAMRARGVGANQLMTGFYTDYIKEYHHRPDSPTGHRAFRQTEAHVVRRTSDDTDYDNDDRIDYVNPFDNIHAGWSRGRDAAYSSAGCQVLIGYPKCRQRGAMPDSGHWKVFKENAYAIPQQQFPYILLAGNDAQRVASLADGEKMGARIRFGSSGKLVERVQDALKTKKFYNGDSSGKFDIRTARSVMMFQESAFGASADDGIIGPNTAEALEVAWLDV